VVLQLELVLLFVNNPELVRRLFLLILSHLLQLSPQAVMKGANLLRQTHVQILVFVLQPVVHVILPQTYVFVMKTTLVHSVTPQYHPLILVVLLHCVQMVVFVHHSHQCLAAAVHRSVHVPILGFLRQQLLLLLHQLFKAVQFVQ
jgi:hypothetical protein